MTTIATKGDGVIAADTRGSDDYTAINVRKLVRLPKGEVAAGSGDLAKVAAGLAWLVGGSQGDAPDILGSSILFTDGGKTYLADGGWPGIEVKGACAIGSGSQGALVAMNLGLSAEDAVRSLFNVDPATGGEVEVLAVEVPRGRSRRAR